MFAGYRSRMALKMSLQVAVKNSRKLFEIFLKVRVIGNCSTRPLQSKLLFNYKDIHLHVFKGLIHWLVVKWSQTWSRHNDVDRQC
jgi:hypothetical protein